MTFDLDVLVVGGGIHGVGVLHDLASRGICSSMLVEEQSLASGTSSRSTKLVHGGLRYLERIRQWGLVREALSERALLLRLLPDIVTPLPFLLPEIRFARAGRRRTRPRWMLRAGVALYDLMRSDSLPRSRWLERNELFEQAPYYRRRLDDAKLRGAFLYYDAQMQDDVVVRIVAEAARRLGATIREGCKVGAVEKIDGGFRCTLVDGGSQESLTARKVVNATGAWVNANLLAWGFAPEIRCLLNVGSHMFFGADVVDASPAGASASIIQNPDDGRVVLFVPWNGGWLLGTTESLLEGSPDDLEVPAGDAAYLLDTIEPWIALKDPQKHLRETFVGVRTMPLRDPVPTAHAHYDRPFDSPYYTSRHVSLSRLSRETVIKASPMGLFSIYGGKFTTYRRQSARLGDRIAAELGRAAPSRTADPACWFLAAIRNESKDLLVTRKDLRHR